MYPLKVLTSFIRRDTRRRMYAEWIGDRPGSDSTTELSKAAENDSAAAAEADRSMAHGLARYLQVRAPRNKYNARRTKIGNITFDSGREAARYLALVEMEQAGEINHLECQPRFKITIGGVPIMMRSKRYPNGRQLTYVSDFTYLDVQNQEKVIEDVKGQRTDVYKIKLALMQAMGYRVREV